MNSKLEEMREAAMELAQYASYAEIVGGVRENRAPIRKWCDEIFRLNNEIDADAFTAAPASDEPVKVKPLEWRDGVSPRTLVANTILGTYKVMGSNPTIDFIKPGWSRDGSGFAHVETLDEAKAAAQADYEARIRSALLSEIDQDGGKG